MVAGLDPVVGQTLTLVVAAADANDLTGPGEGRGPERRFRIVTEDELRARLFDREVNLRRIFERSLEEVAAAADDLAGVDAGDKAAAVRRTAGLAGGELAQNAGQAEAVESGFREILAELVNNGVQTSSQTARIEDAILRPLGEITGTLFPEADRAAGALRAVAEDQLAGAPDPKIVPAGADAAAAAEIAAAAADKLAAAMASLLQEMEDLAEYHEALRTYRQILADQEDLLKRTEEEEKADLIKGFFE